VQGETRDFIPLVRNEAYRIAVEECAGPAGTPMLPGSKWKSSMIRGGFVLRLRDDGKDSIRRCFSVGGRLGYYGIAGVQERSRLAGGANRRPCCEFKSGIEIELTIPGSVAYLITSGRHE
jgi:hypothetical protein